jgi:cytochrome c551/c552
MKKIVLILVMVSLAGIAAPRKGASEESEKGSQLFKQRGCAACHDPTQDQTRYGLGPSLGQIAEAYKGHEDDLAKFLRGGCEPIVDKPRFSIMHGEIVKLKGLSDAEIKELQDYICEEQ